MFEDYRMISGDDYFLPPCFYYPKFRTFLGTEFFDFDEGFWLFAELCEAFLQTLLETLFLPIKQEMLSLEI